MIFILLCTSSLFKEIENTIKEETPEIVKVFWELSNLTLAREKLNELINQSSSKTLKTREESIIPLSLVGINSSRTKQYSNFLMPFQIFRKKEKLPSNIAPSFIAKQGSPVFKFRSITLCLARHIIFSPISVHVSSTIRQFRISFYLGNELAFTTHTYDLPKEYSEPIAFDFETDILFNSMHLDVVQNWGDNKKTYMNHFQLYGP